MGEFSQKRLIRKLDLERFLGTLTPQPAPQARLEQYTISEQAAANMLYIAAYSNDDIAEKSILDLGCGTGRLALGAAFLGAKEVAGVDIDKSAINTAHKNSLASGLGKQVQWVNASINSIIGCFDTVLMNPPFGVQMHEADRSFLVKSLEVASSVYSFHKHPEVDQKLIGQIKGSSGFLHVQPSSFLKRFIENHGGTIVDVYSMVMSIPRMFDFHTKLRHDFVIDLYVIKKYVS
jgi:putative methylase